MTADELTEIKTQLEDLDNQVGALETDIANMEHCGAPTERDERALAAVKVKRAELHRQSGARLEYDAKGDTVRVFDPRPFDRHGKEPVVTLFDKLEAIALEHLRFPTLVARRRDALDFRDVSVWQVTDALRAAYELGVVEGPPPRKFRGV